MPRFNQYNILVDVDVNISVDEFLDECDKNDIQKVISYIRKQYNEQCGLLQIPSNIFDEEWNKIINKLANSRLQMSLEDIETIKQIYKKY